MFINYSNHPVQCWPQTQKDAAEKFGRIIDLPFPQVDAFASSESIKAFGESELKRMQEIIATAEYGEDIVVLCTGEYVLTFYIVSELKRMGIKVVCASTKRISVEKLCEDGTVVKHSEFRFVAFREYI